MSDQAETAARQLPLFYRDPQPLAAAVHGDWRLKGGDLAFAADAHLAPLLLAEFPLAARWYPVLFAADDAAPVALLGLERRNLFLDEGQWAPDAYVPAYIRRYPFGFVATSDPDRFALAIDAASDAVIKDGGEGEPLFVDGKPSPLTEDALKFCDAFHGEADGARAFCQAIVEAGLLLDRRADITTPDGRKFGIDGFKIVDPKRFADLDGDTVLDWHRKGWLGLVQFHLASLDRFADLMTRQGDRPAAAAPIAAE